MAALEQDLSDSLTPHYELIKPLGVGGMGAVFLAREPALKRLVAVKVLAPALAAEAKPRARFEREARAAAALSHPNVVRVYAVGETAGERLPYIVMQYVDGPTLAEWMSEHPRVAEREARRIIGQVASALGAAHARDLVHRDIKPSNVLLERESGRAYVADFGVSAALSPEGHGEQTKLTATGMMVGTPVYMSPEQAAAEPVTPRSDVYSLGILAYELLTGELPYRASSAMGWAAAHLKDTPTPVGTRRPEVAPEVARLVDRCLAKAPVDRPAPEEIARGMLPSLETEIEWPPPGLRPLHGAAVPLVRTLLVAAAGAIVAALALAHVPEILQVHPGWIARFQIAQEVLGEERRLRATSPATGEVAFFAWIMLLALGGVMFAVALLSAVGRLWRLLRAGVRSRALGWQWHTVADVFSDSDGRSGLLLSGGGPFASLERRQREKVLANRRRRVAALLVGCFWPVGAVGLWLLLVAFGIASGRMGRPVVPAGLMLVTVLPALVALATGAVFELRERRLLGPLARRRTHEAAGDDVARWYEALPGLGRPTAPPAAGRATRIIRRVAMVGPAVIAVITLVGLGELAIASLTAARFVQRTGPRTAELLARLDQLTETDPLGRARAIWRPYMISRERDDSATIALARSLGGLASDSPPAYAESRQVLDALRDSVLAMLEAAPGERMAPALADRLAAVAEHPRTLVFRRLARAMEIDLLWAGLDRPLEEYPSPWAIPIFRLPLDAAAANALGAMLALRRGDGAGAMTRLGENAAFADQLMDGSTLLDFVVGRVLMQRSTLRQLALVERWRGNPAAAAALEEAIGHLDATRITLAGFSGLAVDPANLESWKRALYNPALPHGYRPEIFFAVWGGICGSPWELLAGPSRARLDAAVEVADSVPGVPYARTLARMIHNAWEQPWLSLGERPAPAPFPRTPSLQRAPWMLVMRVEAFC